MAYEPTVWVDDETPVNAENLNKLEQGVAEIHTAKENGELDGTPGKSAYEYAQDGGYTGTEEEFARKLASESSAIHIGSEPPEDENVTVWIDTDEEPAESGGEQADWNAPEGEPGHVLNRTHYENGTEMKTLFDQTITVANNAWQDYGTVNLVDGNTYTVVWDGTEYESVAFATVFNGANAIALGNPYLMGVGENNNQPFVFGWAYDYGVLAGGSMTNGDHTIKITEEVKVYKKLDECYLPDLFNPLIVPILWASHNDQNKPNSIGREDPQMFDVIAQALWDGRRVILDFTRTDLTEIGLYKAEVTHWRLEPSEKHGFNIRISYFYSSTEYHLTLFGGTWTPPTT